MKKAFLVQTLGYWGRGQTLKAAAEACLTAGAKPKDLMVVDLIVGDETPEVTNNGRNLTLKADSEIIRIGKGFPLLALLKLQS